MTHPEIHPGLPPLLTQSSFWAGLTQPKATRDHEWGSGLTRVEYNEDLLGVEDTYRIDSIVPILRLCCDDREWRIVSLLAIGHTTREVGALEGISAMAVSRARQTVRMRLEGIGMPKSVPTTRTLPLITQFSEVSPEIVLPKPSRNVRREEGIDVTFRPAAPRRERIAEVPFR